MIENAASGNSTRLAWGLTGNLFLQESERVLEQAVGALRSGQTLAAVPALRALAGERLELLVRMIKLLVITGNAKAALQLGYEAFIQGRYQDSQALAQTALDAGLQEAAFYYLLAANAVATKRYQLAADLARVGIALAPAPTAARRDLAVLLWRLQRPQEAVTMLENVPFDQLDRLGRETLGISYGLAGRRDRARQIFAGLLAEDPSHPFAGRALELLAPPPSESVLASITKRLAPPLATIFARLCQGPATEDELARLLAAGGYRRILFKALLRDLVASTRLGTIPLVKITNGMVSLETAILDTSRAANERSQEV